jgi:HEAT repeat protein
VGKISGIQIENMKLDKNLNGLVLALKDEDKYIRKEAAFALGEVGNRDCTKYILESLNDESAPVRAVAVISIAKIGKSTNAEIKENILKLLNDKDWSVRCAALKSLEIITGDEYLDKITTALLDEDPHVQDMAFKILEKIKDRDNKVNTGPDPLN